MGWFYRLFRLANDESTLTLDSTVTLKVTNMDVSTRGSGLINLGVGSSLVRVTNGAEEASPTETTTNKINYQYLNFDKDTIEYCQWQLQAPGDYDGGTMTAKFLWGAGSSTGDVVWAIQGVALADLATIDSAFGTAVTSTDSLSATSKIQISPATSAMTISGTPTTAKWIILQVYRNATAGTDTLDADARLIGVQLTYTRSSTV